MPKPRESTARHPIQVVAQRTGLSVDAIRVWERRHDAIRPRRLANGRRSYTDKDIERLQLLHKASRSGRRIGEVAGLSTSRLRALVCEDMAAGASPGIGTNAENSNSEEIPLGDCLEAARSMDDRALLTALDRAMVLLAVPALLEQVIAPLLRSLGREWREGHLRPSNEHMATATVRTFLGQLLVSSNVTETGPSMVVSTPLGQTHELGALMAGVTAARLGWNVTYLGPCSTSQDIAHSASVKDASVVVLGISYPPDDSRLTGELRRLRRQVPDGTTLLIGGRASSDYAEVLSEIGAVVCTTFSELGDRLDQVRRGQSLI